MNVQFYTFSSETSSDFKLLPTTRNSSSSSTILLYLNEKEKVELVFDTNVVWREIELRKRNFRLLVTKLRPMN